MTDEEKKAINLLKVFKLSFRDNKPYKTTYTLANGNEYTGAEIENIFETALNLIQKQEKVIDEMAGYLAIIRDCPNEDKGANLDCENRCNNTDEIYEECWKQYFYRKAEEDD